MKLRVLSALTLAAAATFGTAQADEIEEFYSGKTVQMIVGYSAGGGYDLYARTLARHIGNHIPGNPNVVVRNVPGAGSMVATNQIANTLPQDGTIIGTVGRGMAFEPLFGNEQAQFAPRDLGWLGSMNNETSICAAWHTSGVETYEDLYETELTVGGTGAGADTDLFPKVMYELLGMQFVPISGYPGGNDVLLAMERGEVQGRCGWSWSSARANNPEWFEDGGEVNLLFQMSLEKHPELPDTPLVTDFAETEFEEQVLNLLFARQVMGRPFVTTPNVPEERLRALRQAFVATMEDEDFLRDARNQNLELSWVDGDRIQQIISDAVDYPSDVVDFIANIE